MHALTNALKIINAFFANIVPIGDILWTFPQNFSWYANIPIIGSIPFAIYLLLGMGIYFSIRTKFVQFRYFKRGIQVLTKKKKDTTGVSPLAAFMLSAAMRVGPGNIIGVTGAISLGGPGAMFWMWISALLGMASSFVEATLAQIFKEKDGDEYVGGLPYYGQKLAGNKKGVGIALAILFIIYAMLSIPIQTFHVFTAAGTAIASVTGVSTDRTSPLYYALAIILIIGIAIAVFGGIKRVTAVTDRMVPVMAVLYATVIVGLFIANIHLFPTMKSMGAAKNEANNAAQSAPVEKTVEKAIAEVKETYDFSNVEVEPLFKDMVDFDTFSKSDFRAVKVKECEAVPKSKKLLKFVLDDGSGVDRVILSGIHDYYEPEFLVGKTLLAITNLPPRKMMGIDSCGMIISATHLVEGREGLNVLILDDKIPAGAKLY